MQSIIQIVITEFTRVMLILSVCMILLCGLFVFAAFVHGVSKAMKMTRVKKSVEEKNLLTYTPIETDVLSALQNLGYTKPEREAALEAAKAIDPNADFPTLLRNALKQQAARYFS